MNTRLALIGVSLGALLAACETTGGGSAGAGSTGSSGAAMPAGSKPDAGSSASTGSAASGSAPSSPASGGTTGTGSTPPSGRGDGSADPGVPAKTPSERRADIDGKLDDSLGRFDEQLRREQQRAATERDAKAAARAEGAVVDATSNRDGDKEKDGGRDEIQRDRTGDLKSAGTQQGTTEGASDNADTAAADQARMQRQGGGGTGSKPIPSGVDDDIVARRLRRAAENETDPELREKLWNEYRDYKENTQASK